MIGIRVIKSYEVVRELNKTAVTLPYDDDLAISQFRAFFPVASVLTRRVTTEYAKNVMREVLETLLSDLK